MKEIKKEAVLIMLNLITLLSLAVTTLDTQRNRNLYIEESKKNALLTIEINDRNNIIEDLQNKLKKIYKEKYPTGYRKEKREREWKYWAYLAVLGLLKKR